MDNRYKLALIIYFTFLNFTFAGNIFVVDYPNQAEVKIYIVQYPNQADLHVHTTDKILIARDRDEVWHYVKYPNQADIKIYFVDYPNHADIKVYFVNYINQARWRVDSEYKGVFKKHTKTEIKEFQSL